MQRFFESEKINLIFNKDDFYKTLFSGQPINIYSKRRFQGYDFSILKICIFQKELELIKKIFDSNFMQARPDHDWDEVYAAFNLSLQNKSLLQILINYYKPKLPTIHKEDITPYLTSITENENIFNFHFNNFTSKEIWRLFIDGYRQREEYGWLEYEDREPGFMQGMLNGFQYIQEAISEPLTIDFLKKLHAACSDNVKNLHSTHRPGYFRDGTDIGFDINMEYKKTTVAGFIELLENMEPDNDASYTLGKDRVELKAISSDKIQDEIEKIINKYNKNIVMQLNADGRLNCIIDLITALERAHPFSDANCRTFCILLLNKELIRNGFSPVILDDPNRFDGYSKAELFNEICNGMRKFQEVKSGIIKDLGMSTEEISNLIATNNLYQFNSVNELLNSQQTTNIKLNR